MVVKQCFQYKIFSDLNSSPFLTQSYHMASEDLYKIYSMSQMEYLLCLTALSLHGREQVTLLNFFCVPQEKKNLHNNTGLE